MKLQRPGINAAPLSLILALAALPLLSTLQGCGRAEPPAASDTTTARSYTIRGIIRQLPAPDQAGVPLLIHHEAIADYVNASGNAAPMDAMTMPFSTDAGLDMAGLAAGDKVVFELRVDWNADAAMLITSIEKLPRDTVLEFEAGD